MDPVEVVLLKLVDLDLGVEHGGEIGLESGVSGESGNSRFWAEAAVSKKVLMCLFLLAFSSCNSFSALASSLGWYLSKCLLTMPVEYFLGLLPPRLIGLLHSSRSFIKQ